MLGSGLAHRPQQQPDVLSHIIVGAPVKGCHLTEEEEEGGQ